MSFDAYLNVDARSQGRQDIVIPSKVVIEDNTLSTVTSGTLDLHASSASASYNERNLPSNVDAFVLRVSAHDSRRGSEAASNDSRNIALPGRRQ
jgi:hypothetical protein